MTDHIPTQELFAHGPAVRVGLFGVGLDTYWPQFAGLKERLEGYQEEIAEIIRSAGNVDLTNVGLVDNSRRAATLGSLFRQKQIDILFLYISTYALSSTVLPIVREAGVPVIILNIQPVAAIDYATFNAMGDRGKMTGEWLAHCQACALPEFVSVLKQARIDYHLLTGYLGDADSEREVCEWVSATMTAKIMRTNRLGVMGHYYGGMLDVYTDLSRQLATFGGHVEIMEIDELAEIRASLSNKEVAVRVSEFRQEFQVSPECEQVELERAAQTSLALDRLVARHDLGSLAYYYEGVPGSVHEDIISSVIAGNTLLTSRHVPIAGEYEVKNAQAMKILDSFGVGGSFSEFYAMDFTDDVVLLGHDGPAHSTIAEGRVGLVPLPLYHGKPGKGLSIQMTVQHGPVTILSVVEGPDEIFLLVAEAESVPGPVLQIGNTNSRYRFSLPAKEFIEQWALAGPAHHSAIGLGHIASRLKKFAQLIGISMRQIC